MWDEYKLDIDKNPDKIEKATNKGIQTESTKRPYLQSGFYAYVYRKEGHHIHQYFENTTGAYDEYLGIVTCIRNEWRSDHISGTMTGRYKAPNLTARINGLTEKQDIEVKGQISPFTPIDLDVQGDNGTS